MPDLLLSDKISDNSTIFHYLECRQLADTCYTPQPEPKGRCLPVSSYSPGSISSQFKPDISTEQ
jgi:hypothetical protein